MANKMDLVERVATTISCTKADGERAVEAIIAMITDTLKKGEEVSIAGLGIFRQRRAPAAWAGTPAQEHPSRSRRCACPNSALRKH